MVGRNSAANNFGPTSWVVGQTLGDGCNYAGGAGIQQAIDDVFALGGGIVYVRASTVPYVVNLTLRDGVDLIGITVDGRPPAFFNQVIIQGAHTFTPAAGDAEALVSNIHFEDPAFGDLFTINSSGGGSFVLFAAKFCNLTTFSGGVGVGRAAVVNAGAGSSCLFVVYDGQITSDNIGIETTGAGSAQIQMTNSQGSSATDFIRFSSTASNIVLSNSDIGANNFGINDTVGLCGMQLSRSSIGASGPAIHTAGLGASVEVYHCNLTSSAGSGFAVDGTGNFQFVDIGFLGSAVGLDPAMNIVPIEWQPYAKSATAPALPSTLVGQRGTSCFDDTEFTVTDGFVQIIGGPPAGSFPTDSGTATPAAGVLNILGGPGVTTSAAGNTVTINSVVWTDAAGMVTVTPDSGTIDTSGLAVITLPAAPLRGEECRIISVLAGTVVTANVGQQIQIGAVLSSVGGTATGTAAGDTLYLTWSPSGVAWFSIATTGNWVLA